MNRALSIAAATAVGLALVAFGLRSLARSRTVQLFSAPVGRVATTDSVVALTFDDGPTEQLTDSLIRILESRDVRATFFVIGAEVAHAPEAARALSDGIVRHILEQVRPGSIILLHPWYPSRATSLAAVPLVIDSLRSRGYGITTVGDLLARNGARR